jgi:hypothetical protein
LLFNGCWTATRFSLKDKKGPWNFLIDFLGNWKRKIFQILNYSKTEKIVFVVAEIRSFCKIQQIRKVLPFSKIQHYQILEIKFESFFDFFVRCFWNWDNLGFEIFVRRLDFFVLLVVRIMKKWKLSRHLETFLRFFLPQNFPTWLFPEVNSITPPRLHTSQKRKLNYFPRGLHYEKIWCFFIRFSNTIFPYKRMTLFSSKALKWKKNLEEKWGKYEVNLFGRWYE